MKTVAVIEGFAGGPRHTKEFRTALQDAGFKVIKDRHQADIIIAHSAGIYGIPLDSPARLLILIGPTYWPGQKLAKRLLRHTKASKRYHVSKFGWRYYIWKKSLEIYYFFKRHRYLWLGIIHNNRLDRLNKLANIGSRKVIIIHNHEDLYSSPRLRDVFGPKNVKFVEFKGIHDDYATNPKPYVDLLSKEL